MAYDDMLVQLKEIGMNGYEAKVYLALISMNSASPRELHESTGIPRGRVYETLTILEKKGFIVSNKQSPVRYRIADIPQTIERLKHEAIAKYDILGITLQTYAAPEMTEHLPQTYIIQTEWGVKITSVCSFEQQKTNSSSFPTILFFTSVMQTNSRWQQNASISTVLSVM